MYKRKFIKILLILPLIFQLFACNKTTDNSSISSIISPENKTQDNLVGPNDENLSENEIQNDSTGPQNDEITPENQPQDSINSQNDEIRIHFIDVGQADATLIEGNNYSVLIDAGNNDDGRLVVDYLKQYNITKLNAVIGTHPHEDHIGGLDVVIENFDIEHIYLPEFISSTKTFEDVLNAIAEKSLEIEVPTVGQTFDLGTMNFTILSPANIYEDSNDNSIVLLLNHHNNRFMFTGDAEKDAERDILTSGINIQANVLKVGHHGSTTSTSNEFLNAVSPSIAIIPVGKDNSYGHPHQEILDKLLSKNIEVYRTDLNGHIVLKSTIDEIIVELSKKNVDTPKENIEDNTEEVEQTFIGNVNSKKFHLQKCNGLPAERNRVNLNSREEAIKLGYEPCGNCHP